METSGNQWPATQWKPSSYFLCDLLCKETFTFGFNKIKINKNSALTDSSANNLIYPKSTPAKRLLLRLCLQIKMD